MLYNIITLTPCHIQLNTLISIPPDMSSLTPALPPPQPLQEGEYHTGEPTTLRGSLPSIYGEIYS